MRKPLGLVCALAVLAIPASASAAMIEVSLPDYDSAGFGDGFPIDLGIIDTFFYAIDPGVTITSATIGGTYGTAEASSSTASFNAVVDGFEVVACPEFSPTCFGIGDPFRPFSVALPIESFASLLDNSATLGIIQTTGFRVRYGTPTLTITYVDGAIPEPATWAMMLLGFMAVGASVRASARKGKKTITYS